MINNFIKRGKKYVIKEKPNGSTPPELKAIGRHKMGGDFKEVVPLCRWSPSKKKYETGLDEFSDDFQLSTPEKVKALKEERKDLIEYLNNVSKNYEGGVTEYISERSVELYHNKIVDTTSLEKWLELFLLMQSRSVTPKSELDNPDYNVSNYYIEDADEAKDVKEEFRTKKRKAKTWVYTNIDNSKEDVIEVFRYLKIIGINENKSEGLLTETFEKRVERDPDFVDEFLETIDKNINDIYMYNNLVRKFSKGVVKKEKEGYFHEDKFLGRTLKDAVETLKKKGNEELSAKIFG